jgi:Protein of unknown function (DUF3551)
VLRKSVVTLFIIVAALVGETQISNAQSPYSYPWCSLGGAKDSNALSCYYSSRQQCLTTMSGIGGNCVESPYYHPQPTQLSHRALAKPHHRRARTARVNTPERLE